MADPSSPYPEKIFCTEEDVFKLLICVDCFGYQQSLRIKWDMISGRVLKGTSHSIAHCSTCQLKLGKYHKNGKFLHCPQFPNLKLILMTLATTDLSLSSRLSVSYLRDISIALLL